MIKKTLSIVVSLIVLASLGCSANPELGGPEITNTDEELPEATETPCSTRGGLHQQVHNEGWVCIDGKKQYAEWTVYKCYSGESERGPYRVISQTSEPCRQAPLESDAGVEPDASEQSCTDAADCMLCCEQTGGDDSCFEACEA